MRLPRLPCIFFFLVVVINGDWPKDGCYVGNIKYALDDGIDWTWKEIEEHEACQVNISFNNYTNPNECHYPRDTLRMDITGAVVSEFTSLLNIRFDWPYNKKRKRCKWENANLLRCEYDMTNNRSEIFTHLLELAHMDMGLDNFTSNFSQVEKLTCGLFLLPDKHDILYDSECVTTYNDSNSDKFYKLKPALMGHKGHVKGCKAMEKQFKSICEKEESNDQYDDTCEIKEPFDPSNETAPTTPPPPTRAPFAEDPDIWSEDNSTEKYPVRTFKKQRGRNNSRLVASIGTLVLSLLLHR